MRLLLWSNWVVSTTTFAIGCAVKSIKRAKNTTAAFARSRITRWITSIAGWWKFLPEEISKPSANTEVLPILQTEIGPSLGGSLP